MEIRRKVQAGTMQSSDLMVFLEPAAKLRIEIEATVKKQFEHLIRAKVKKVLTRHGVTAGRDPVPLLRDLNEEYRRLRLTMGGVADILGLAFGWLSYLGLPVEVGEESYAVIEAVTVIPALAH